MPSNGRTLRVFVASPGDVGRERDAMLGVVNELNRTLEALIPAAGVRLDLVRWETHTHPGLGRPQELINEQIGTYDIFVGIMWKRFGAPTGAAESGTQEEFELALTRWQKHGTPRICFYFSNAAAPPPRAADEIDQLQHVAAFRTQLMHLGLISEYEDASTFPAMVRPHLTLVVGEMIRERQRSPRGSTRRPNAAALADQALIGKAVTFAEIGPQDACYHQRDKYLGRSGVIIEAQQVKKWLRGTFRFNDPLFPGDDRMYSFLQFRVTPV
jgi:hypothetical protein